jgi:hypothetical protein
MKWYLPQMIAGVFAGTGVVPLAVAAETVEHAGGPTQALANVSDQLVGFESPTSEALLLVVFILLVLAVIVHKPKAP